MSWRLDSVRVSEVDGIDLEILGVSLFIVLLILIIVSAAFGRDHYVYYFRIARTPTSSDEKCRDRKNVEEIVGTIKYDNDYTPAQPYLEWSKDVIVNPMNPEIGIPHEIEDDSTWIDEEEVENE
ncbi:uncharacterized protein [Venturia canescens]|uniref:uncharacterized protein n=1 Tax=Venturia canescens TaxID=32260 RepID=UPI001C9C4C35|nr:uncharacterized protein LOC122418007 [Venturia canescens]